ncbi:MAG: hypothetical protein EOO76_17820 [Novosphingobium sp.]|nr:MAG: hypothetical protein EOO76_17820 [Novosphingobium sp.]
MGRPDTAIDDRAARAVDEIELKAVAVPTVALRFDADAREGEVAIVLVEPDRRALAHLGIVGPLGEHVVDLGLKPAGPRSAHDPVLPSRRSSRAIGARKSREFGS